MFLSIVIAAYNEEENVEELTNRIYASFTPLGIPFELIYVIDGSDRSCELLQKMRTTKDTMHLDCSPLPRGFKNAFVHGFNMVSKKATHILTLDADLNHRPEEIGLFIRAMEESNADIVIGSRYMVGGQIMNLGILKRMVSLIANIITEIIFKLRIKDKTSGFRLYKKEALMRIVPSCTSQGFEFLFEILLVAKNMHYSLKEVPILFETHERGRSKFRLVRTSKGYCALVWKYWLHFS